VRAGVARPGDKKSSQGDYFKQKDKNGPQRTQTPIMHRSALAVNKHSVVFRGTEQNGDDIYCQYGAVIRSTNVILRN